MALRKRSLKPKTVGVASERRGLVEWRSRYMTIRPAGSPPSRSDGEKGDSELDGSQWISAPNDFQLTLPLIKDTASKRFS